VCVVVGLAGRISSFGLPAGTDIMCIGIYANDVMSDLL
jgi:hypothetical protein